MDTLRVNGSSEWPVIIFGLHGLTDRPVAVDTLGLNDPPERPVDTRGLHGPTEWPVDTLGLNGLPERHACGVLEAVFQ